MRELERPPIEISDVRQRIEQRYKERNKLLNIFQEDAIKYFESRMGLVEVAQDGMSKRDEFVNNFGVFFEDIAEARQDFFNQLKDSKNKGNKTDFAQTIDIEDGVRILINKVLEKEEEIESDKIEELKDAGLMDTLITADAAHTAVEKKIKKGPGKKKISLEEEAMRRDNDKSKKSIPSQVGFVTEIPKIEPPMSLLKRLQDI